MRNRWISWMLLITVAVVSFAGIAICEEVVSPEASETVVEGFWVKYIPVVAEAIIGIVIGLWGAAKAKYHLVDGPRDTALQKAKIDVLETIENVAEELYVEKVRALKAASSDGKLTTAEIDGLQSNTWERVLERLKGQGKQLVVEMGRSGLNKLLARVIGNAKVGG